MVNAKMRLLVLYHAGFTFTQAVFDYLDAFRRYSRHEIEFFNVDQDHDHGLDFSKYDAVFVNFCVVSVARVEPPKFMGHIIQALRDFRGAKIISIQDEYDFVDNVKDFLRKVGFDIVLTCVPSGAIDKVYSRLPSVRFERVLTGYIAEGLADDSDEIRPLAERDIPIGYRGRELPYRLGDLGWHKAEIGHRFKRACGERGIACDIDVTEDSRFHGDAWLRFVRRCRVMLGTPSGANVFDFDGSLHHAVKARYLKNPGLRYADVRDMIMKRSVDFDMGQVSARVFEAAASRTALALLRGSYSGVLEPDEHYVPVEPDYSNVGDVLDRVQDVNAMQAMADRTYHHVVGNPWNHYDGFIDRIDGLVDGVTQVTPPRAHHSDLRVTKEPLGNDPYMVGKLMELRREMQDQVEGIKEVMRAAAERRLEVVQHRDGTMRVLRFATPQ